MRWRRDWQALLPDELAFISGLARWQGAINRRPYNGTTGLRQDAIVVAEKGRSDAAPLREA